MKNNEGCKTTNYNPSYTKIISYIFTLDGSYSAGGKKTHKNRANVMLNAKLLNFCYFFFARQLWNNLGCSLCHTVLNSSTLYYVYIRQLLPLSWNNYDERTKSGFRCRSNIWDATKKKNIFSGEHKKKWQWNLILFFLFLLFPTTNTQILCFSLIVNISFSSRSRAAICYWLLSVITMI